MRSLIDYREAIVDVDPDTGLTFAWTIARGPWPGTLRIRMPVGAHTVSEVATPWICLQYDMRLAGEDPAKAYAAGWELDARPAQAVEGE